MPSEADLKRFDEHLLGLIRTHGNALQGVGPTEDQPGGYSWVYTLGLSSGAAPWEGEEHPEFVIFGLPYNTSAVILNDLAARVRDGETFVAGERYNDVIRSADESRLMPVQMVAVARGFISRKYDYFNTLRRFHGGMGFNVMQVVWPDANGLLPWDEGFDHERFDESQPILDEAAFTAAR